MSGVSFNNPYSSYVNQQTPAGPNDFYFTLARYALDNPATQTLVWTGATFVTGNVIRGALQDVRNFFGTSWIVSKLICMAGIPFCHLASQRAVGPSSLPFRSADPPMTATG
jgi:hypothetical protein